ncbi:MAG: exodeoxyribonuclease III [Cyanobacteria bacterium P01_F01_bin.33]
MQIATWNVNSIRTRLEHVLTWLTSGGGKDVGVLCLQETKVTDEQFPQQAFCDRDFHVYFYGQKSYNGVALIAREPLEDIQMGFSAVLDSETARSLDDQKRVIAASWRGASILNLYVPNGSEVGSEKYGYKLMWLQTLRAYLEARSTVGNPVSLICGDFNVALEDRDIYNPDGKETHIMSSPVEREALRSAVLDLEFRDAFRKFEADGGHFSWWDYRRGGFARNRGWRIDHHYLTPELYDRAITCTIDREPRGWEKPSDHTPVIVELADS